MILALESLGENDEYKGKECRIREAGFTGLMTRSSGEKNGMTYKNIYDSHEYSIKGIHSKGSL